MMAFIAWIQKCSWLAIQYSTAQIGCSGYGGTRASGPEVKDGSMLSTNSLLVDN